ncbi:hypothetical protein MCOR25_010913 [Pyricularia grisea]|nr:hypothetical protein MCOR25_010913 [Pyricularia grisea]
MESISKKSGDYDTPEQLVSPASKVSTSPMKADAFEAQFGKCTQIEQFQPEILDPDEERLVEPFGVDSWGSLASAKKCCKKCRCCKRKNAYEWGEDTVAAYTAMKRRTNREILWDDFERSWRMDLSGFTKNGTFDTEGGPDADILIHHCQVYVLADRYGITRLMDVSLQKLHQALVKSKIPKNNLSDIVALVRFCYGELVPEKLRQMVIHYISCNVEACGRLRSFRSFWRSMAVWQGHLWGLCC